MLKYLTVSVLTVIGFSLMLSCNRESRSISVSENIIRADTFLVHRRQSHIGQEVYAIDKTEAGFTISSSQGENERGRISGTRAKLMLNKNLTPLYYENIRVTDKDTTNILKVEYTDVGIVVSELFMEPVKVFDKETFPLHSDIPAAMEMMLYHYYFTNNKPERIKTVPRGEVKISFSKQDTVRIKGEHIVLDRYTATGINWGKRTLWVDQDKNLIAVVYANTQFRELIRKGFEVALPTFVQGNVEEQMRALEDYTNAVPARYSDVMALVGADIITGLKNETDKNMTMLIEKGVISQIGKREEVEIPEHALIIDLSGKVLIPGLWDMHAHANQVQFAPAYLAGGITTYRDLGNEIEFATAFRDAINNKNALGPDILLGGMTDGEGITGNGVVRARTQEEAIQVVNRYHKLGYNQIKIYNGVEPEIVKKLTEEAHKKGMTVSGHVPRKVGNAKKAIELGMDHLNHRAMFLSLLFPEEDLSSLGRFFLAEREITDKQINDAIAVLLKNRTVLDPTIALDVVRNITWKTPVETVEPDAYRIAPELFEGKRFQKGVSPQQAAQAQVEIQKSMEIIGRFQKAGVPIVAGTDNAIPVFSLYTEIETYQRLGNFTNLEAIQSATIVSARSMGMDKHTGSLEVGKQADIAILDKNPLEDISHIRSVQAVMTNGKYYDCDPLWQAADFLVKQNK